MSEKIPAQFSEEKNKGIILLAIGAAVSLLLILHTIQLAPLVAWLSGQELNEKTMSAAKVFMTGFYRPNLFMLAFRYASHEDPVALAFAVLGCVFVGAAPIIYCLASNPYRMYPLIHGDAREGNMKDVREMESRAQVGIEGGKYLTLGQWKKTGEPMRLIETLSVLVLAPPGTGKSLAPHEPVLMYDGTTKRTGDLVVGDLLMGPDSRPRHVTNTHPGYGPMFRVIPNKGRSFECNADHILSLRCSKKPRNRSLRPMRGDICHVTVQQWLAWSIEQKGKWKQWRAAVDFPAQSEPTIDPYFLGALIGDGSMVADLSLQTADPEMRELVYAQAEEHGMRVRHDIQEGNASIGYHLTMGSGKRLARKSNPILNKLTELGMRVSGVDKHIPHAYKTGSRQTRLELLAGIIDADGSYDPKGKGYDIVTMSERLADDIAFVARSLGFSAYPKPCEKTCTNTGSVGTYHRVFIAGAVRDIPVRILRRQAMPRIMDKDVTNVGFMIEPIGEGAYFGIIVDGDHQYLLDDFTVTHNTASFVVPSIIETDDSSFIVNDPKPELFDMTSGWRSQLGFVFKIDWSATDTKFTDPGVDGDLEKMVFYPRFNVLNDRLTPPAGTAERDTYLDSIANVMSPSGKGGGKSDYFEEKGRAAMVGFLHYICSKVNDAKNYDGLPPEWVGKEACIPMIIDLINEGLRRASDANDKKKEEAQAAGGFYQGDSLSDWLKAIVAECVAEKYNPRAATEITPLISMAPNERSGILGTMDKAFIPFKNAAVRERTMSCDFVPSDLRGMLDPTDGEVKPVTLYVCVNQAEAAAFATITSLLYEVLSREFLAYGPGDVNRSGVKSGPFPVCFMLDEFAKLPRIEAVMTGPDLGRSKKTYYCLVAQSDAQIGKLYSKEDQQIIYATTAVKYILPQNDKDTVQLVCTMVGPTTIQKSSSSRSRGGTIKDFGKSNESTALEKVDYIRPGDISGMKPGSHLVICQGFMNRPFWLDSVFYFKDPVIGPKVRARGVGPLPSAPMPKFIWEKRIAEWKKANPSLVPKTPLNAPATMQPKSIPLGKSSSTKSP